MEPGTPFGPGIRALLACLHHSHHVSFERLFRIASELSGLSISQGAIANAFRRMEAGMAAATHAITDKVLTARVIASDETTIRTQWYHPLAVGLPLERGRPAQDRPAPGARCR